MNLTMIPMLPYAEPLRLIVMILILLVVEVAVAVFVVVPKVYIGFVDVDAITVYTVVVCSEYDH
jgi:hypothetical protein